MTPKNIAANALDSLAKDLIDNNRVEQGWYYRGMSDGLRGNASTYVIGKKEAGVFRNDYVSGWNAAR